MMTPVRNDYGLCLACRKDAAGHNGSNIGFLTFWKFSLTEDLCVAAMMNRYGMTGKKMGNKLNEAGNLIFENTKKESTQRR